MKKMLVFASLTILTALATAQAADVKEVWAKQCSKCHGAPGKGDTKMGKKLDVKDYTDAKVQAAMKDDEMFKAIKQGIKEGDKTKMKAFTDLSDADIKALVAIVRNLKK
jgi:mono/diheme cytochrome c family protein